MANAKLFQLAYLLFGDGQLLRIQAPSSELYRVSLSGDMVAHAVLHLLQGECGGQHIRILIE